MITLRRIPLVLAAILVGYLLLLACYKIGYVSIAGAAPTGGAAATEGAPYRVLYAQADLPDAGVDVPPSGSGSSTTPAPAPPADQLHNPLTDPRAAWDDVKAAKKIGWPLALLAGLIMVARALGYAGDRWPKFKAFAKLGGITGTIVAGVSACGAAAFNTLALGGTWFAVAAAAVGAFFALLHPNPPKTLA